MINPGKLSTWSSEIISEKTPKNKRKNKISPTRPTRFETAEKICDCQNYVEKSHLLQLLKNQTVEGQKSSKNMMYNMIELKKSKNSFVAQKNLKRFW